jgi:hypothetical protein
MPLDALVVAVISPPELTEIDGFAVMVVAGVVALPAGVVTETSSIASYPLLGETIVVPGADMDTDFEGSNVADGTLVVMSTALRPSYPLEGETVWLPLAVMVILFDSSDGL